LGIIRSKWLGLYLSTPFPLLPVAWSAPKKGADQSSNNGSIGANHQRLFLYLKPIHNYYCFW